MKKLIRRIIVVGFLVGGGYFAYAFFFSGTPDTASQQNAGDQKSVEYTVQKKDFESSVKLEGKTKMQNEQNLQFNTNDRITDVLVTVGDTVKKGQILAKMSTSQVDSNIESQRISLENANSRLDTFIDTAKNVELKKVNLSIQSTKLQIDKKQYEIDYTRSKNQRDLEQAKLSLQEAKNNLEILKKETEKNIAEFQRTAKTKDQVIQEKTLQLEKIQREYEDFKETFDTKLTKKINEYYTSVESSFVNLGSQINDLSSEIKTVQGILGYKEPAIYYATYFSAENLANRGAALEYLKKSISLYETFEKEYKSINMEHILKSVRSERKTTQLIQTIDAAIDFYNSWYQTTNAISKGFQDSKESDSLSRQNIISYTQQYTKKATDAQTKINELTQLKEDLQSTNSSDTIKSDLERELNLKKQELENAKLEIQRIKGNQNYIVDTAGNNISNAQIILNRKIAEVKQQEIDQEKLTLNQSEQVQQDIVALKNLKIDYQELLKKREKLINLGINEDYKIAQNNVKQAQTSYTEAQEKLENYILRAPFDGVITRVDMKVGDRLTSDDKKYISLVDPEAIEVNLSVSQSDITKIKTGMKAEIVLNSYPNRTFSGSVFEIDTIPTESNGSSKFAVKVVLKKPKDIDVYSGLSAKVTLIAHRIQDAIVVPFMAVNVGENGEQYVTVVKNGIHEQRTVEVGFTDGKYYEIKKGLSVGDTVLEVDYSNVQTTQTKKTQNGDENQNEQDPYQGEQGYTDEPSGGYQYESMEMGGF